ncbi:hypothetical protein CCP2SC5_520008 [Azospirillaceae bacterium]
MGVDFRFARRLAKGLIAGGCLLSAACAPGGNPSDPSVMTPVAIIEPSYVFTLGAHQADVVAMLGPPSRGPRFDRYSQTNELIYSYPYPIIQAESVFPNHATRNEMVKNIHMFFDRNQILVQMAYNINYYYPSITNMPVHRITVLPRVVEKLGFPTTPSKSNEASPPAATTGTETPVASAPNESREAVLPLRPNGAPMALIPAASEGEKQ